MKFYIKQTLKEDISNTKYRNNSLNIKLSEKVRKVTYAKGDFADEQDYTFSTF